MRVQIVHPPVFLNVRSLTALRPSPPLGLAYVAAALREAGHEVRILDAVAEGVDVVRRDGDLHRLGLDVDQILARIDPQADVVGFGNMWSFSWPLVREVVHRVRETFPRPLLIAGGEHFSGLPELSMKESPLDFIVLGEGEETAVELLGCLERGSDAGSVPGLTLRRKRRIERTPPRSRKSDLDSLPWPAWDLFDLRAYNDHALLPGLRNGFSVPVLATRGCPYQCTYCSSPSMWTTRWYAREPARVADEIEHWNRTYGADNFPFQDLTAILRRDWILAFGRELLRRRLDIHWQLPSGTRCEVIDREVAELLARTGGHHLAFAPESGSEETRRRIRKQMKRDSLLDSVRAAVDAGLSLTCFFVIGFPEDTARDLRDSVRLARRLAVMGVRDVAVGYFFPIPNTQLYHELREQGRIELTDRFLKTPMFANNPFLRAENHYCRSVSRARLSFTKHWIVANFYALSFLIRPWRLLELVWHVARGVETTKLETFLIELRRKLLFWCGRRQSAQPLVGAPIRQRPARERASPRDAIPRSDLG